MRLRLKQGKQRELITKAKQNKSWAVLGKKLRENKDYLRRDLYHEKRLLKLKTFNKLCRIARVNFSKFVEAELEDNWGRSLGGKNSLGTLKKVIRPEKSEELAELIGIILGDGSLYWNSEKHVYALKITGDLKTEAAYLSGFVKPLIDRVFKINSKIEIKRNGMYVSEYSKEIIKRLERCGLKRGNKKKNNIGIPNWIKNNKNFLKACIRGLIDTDGSVFRMSKKDFRLIRISFKNKAKKLLMDARRGLISLGFSPSKIIAGEQFFISSKSGVEKYIKNVRFNNTKHKRKISEIAPWCSGQIL